MRLRRKGKITFKLGKEVHKDQLEAFKYYFIEESGDMVLFLAETSTSLFSLDDLTYYRNDSKKLGLIFEAHMKIEYK